MAKKKENGFENTEYWLLYGVDIEKRKIMIDTDIDDESAGYVIRGLLKMSEMNENPIDLYINTSGGECYSGFAIYDTIRSLENILVRTHALGKVISMGVTVFLAGDERYATKYVTFMDHSPSNDTAGKIHDLESEFEETKRLFEYGLQIYGERTKRDIGFWRKEFKFKDQYYNFSQAKELGIITHEYPVVEE